MTPSLQVLELFVLKLVLATLVESPNSLSHLIWHALVSHILNYGFLYIIRHKCERFWGRWCRNLLDEIISKLILDSRLLQEDSFRSHVKDSAILLTCRLKCETKLERLALAIPKIETYQYVKG